MTPGPNWVWPLPRDVRGALAAQGDAEFPKAQPDRVTNPGLLLNKYVPYPWHGSGATWNWECRYTSSRGREQKTSKADGWLQVMAGLSKACKERGGVAHAVEKADERLEMTCTTLTSLGYTVQSEVFRVSWRLVLGLGLPSPFETGIALHHVYGVPVIPGSALKGLARDWAVRHIAEQLGVPQLEPRHAEEWTNRRKLNFGLTPLDLLESLLSSPVPNTSDTTTKTGKKVSEIEERSRLLQEVFKGRGGDKLSAWGYGPPTSPLPSPQDLISRHLAAFSRVFGSTQAQGEVIFLDALPKSLVVNKEPLLELDVMNPHYTEYYKKTSPPADSLDPVPVPFLTVRRDAQFRVRVLSKEDSLLKEAYGWLEHALDELGIGAKTRAGYGQMVASGAGGGTPAERTHDQTIERAIAGFGPRAMGAVTSLIQSIERLPDAEYRLQLASQLRERLRTMGRWNEANSSKAWFIALAKLLPPPGQDQP